MGIRKILMTLALLCALGPLARAQADTTVQAMPEGGARLKESLAGTHFGARLDMLGLYGYAAREVVLPNRVFGQTACVKGEFGLVKTWGGTLLPAANTTLLVYGPKNPTNDSSLFKEATNQNYRFFRGSYGVSFTEGYPVLRLTAGAGQHFHFSSHDVTDAKAAPTFGIEAGLGFTIVRGTWVPISAIGLNLYFGA